MMSVGPLTIRSIGKLLINRPGLPGGRFSGEPPPPLVSLPRSGEKGSRRVMFSRTATGLSAGWIPRVGTSDFAAVTALGTEGFVAGLAATPEGSLPAEATDGLAVVGVPGTAFEPDATPEAGFSGDLVTGLAVAFDFAASLRELGGEPETHAGAGRACFCSYRVGA